MGNAGWLGWTMLVCANALVIFQNYLVMKATLTDIIILTVGAGICFAIEGKEE